MAEPIQSGAEMSFDGWAVVELLGHRRLVGRVTDVKMFGQPMLRIELLVWDEKASGFGPSREQYASPASLYALTPCTEEEARAHVKPRVYDWSRPQLSSPDHHETGLDDQDIGL